MVRAGRIPRRWPDPLIALRDQFGAGVGVAVASSLNDLQESGLFDDLGGFGGPPAFDDDFDFGDPLLPPPGLPEIEFPPDDN